MLFYNQLTELIAEQFIMLALFEATVMGILVFIFKRKPTVRIVLYSAIAGMILSLLSSLIVQGDYGGMGYHERFGWPFPYHTVSRSIEFGTQELVPYSRGFDVFKFIANIVFWAFIPFVLVTEQFNKKNNAWIFSIGSLAIFVMATGYFSYDNFSFERNQRIELEKGPTSIMKPAELEDHLVGKKKMSIELLYPEFQNFQNLDHLPPQAIKIETGKPYHYFAYVVYGSGVPIIRATCFKVDNEFNVIKIGEFPAAGDSHLNYMDVNPKTCEGTQ